MVFSRKIWNSFARNLRFTSVSVPFAIIFVINYLEDNIGHMYTSVIHALYFISNTAQCWTLTQNETCYCSQFYGVRNSCFLTVFSLFFFNSAWCRLEIDPFWATLWTFWKYLAYKNVSYFALHSHKTSKTTWNNGQQTKAPIQCPSVQSQTKAVAHLGQAHHMFHDSWIYKPTNFFHKIFFILFISKIIFFFWNQKCRYNCLSNRKRHYAAI